VAACGLPGVSGRFFLFFGSGNLFKSH